MTVMPAPGANDPQHTRALIGAVLLSIAGGVALLVAVITLTAACQADTSSACPDGSPSFELVLQLVLASAAFAATLAVLHLVKRRAHLSSWPALAVASLLLAAWLVVVDAASHGWDRLGTSIVLLSIVVVAALLAGVIRWRRRAR